MPRDIRIVDSITQIEESVGTALIAGSHGGISSAQFAAQTGLTGVVFDDAGVGKDDAGIESLTYLGEMGCPAATVGYETARIGDGADMASNGVVSHVNEQAAECGCEVGQSAMECAAAMHDSNPEPLERDVSSQLGETRLEDGEPPVWALDSIGLVSDEHEGAITITGSHGERLAGEFESYVQTDVAGITLFDAGVGKDDAGIGRLETMNERGIPAATVDVDTARIGDATSAWENGVLSHVNDVGSSIGISPGDSCPDFVANVRGSQ